MINLQGKQRNMNIQPYILNDVEMPDISLKVEQVQDLFSQLTYSHFPVQAGGNFVGNISENDIRTFESQDTLEAYQYALEVFFVRDNDNWIEVLHAFSKNQSNIMPVLNDDNQYLGYLELQDVMNLFTEAPFLNNPGAILIVEKGYKDYSFSEISQIVESNGAHMLGAFVSRHEDDLAQVTVKTGPTALDSLLQSFRRYGYKVVSKHQEDSFSSNLDERSRYLNKYLNI